MFSVVTRRWLIPFFYPHRIRCCNMQTYVNDETREVVFLYKLVRSRTFSSAFFVM